MNQNRAKFKGGVGKPYFINIKFPSAKKRKIVPTKDVPTEELIKNAFRAIIKPHRAFKEIPGGKKINYKTLIPLIIIWGAIFIILNFAFAQNSWLFQWGYWPVTLFYQALYGFLLWFGGSIIFFAMAKILKRKVSLYKIEVGVFYLWVVWAIMPFFDLPHLLFKIPMISILGRGAHLSWVFAFPVLAFLTFFFLKDVFKFKRKELILIGCFSFFLPFLGRFVLEDIPVFLNNFLRLFNKPAGFQNCALILSTSFLIFFVHFRRFLLKEIPLQKFILHTPSFLLITILLWGGIVYFTPWLSFPTGGEFFSFSTIHRSNNLIKGISRWTSSFTWDSGDKEGGTIQHPPSGAGNDNNNTYWSDTYASGAFDFVPSRVTVQELRVKVHFTSATANKRSGLGPKAQGCWQVGTTSTYYCSNWIEDLNGASTQTFTISSSSIRTYVAAGDGAAAGSSEWNSLVNNLQSGGENIIVHSWTEGDGDGNAENGDKIAFDEVYAQVYYTGGDFTQHTYRWYVNKDAIQPDDPWPSGATNLAENTPITTSDSPPTDGDVLRIRINVKGAMNSGTEAFKLQYGQGSTCSSISTWTDVGSASSSAIWRGYNNSTPSDGATITSILLSNSTKSGTYEEENNSANNPNTATMSDYTEYDWVIQDNGASENTTYCFRMVESGGTPLDTYTNYPKLTTKPAIINQRAYIFENDDGANVNSNSDITSANTALTNVFRGMRFVARFQLDETNNTSTGNKTYKLQYDKDGDGNWIDVQMAGAPSSNSGGNFGEWEINTISGASEPASVGKWSSVAVPADGKPVISFYNATDGNLAVCKCNDSACILTPTCNYAVDSTNDVGGFSSIAIGADGYPVIAHIDNTNDRVRVCDCDDAFCSSASCNTLNAVPANYNFTAPEGDHSLDIAVDSNGYPWISFMNTTSDQDLEVCHCNDTACAGQNEACITVDTAGNAGNYSSIALDSSGNPIVAYYDWSTTDLNVAKYVGSGGTGCASSAWTCTSSIDEGGKGPSIAILEDGTPVIAHHTDLGTGWGASLEYCKCGNSSCSSGNICGQIKDLGDYGNFTSLNIGKDGLPIITDYNYNNADLYFYKCNDTFCSGGDEFYQNLDSTGSVGKTSSIAIGPDGWPVISYWDETNTNLKVAKMMPLVEIKASWGISGSNGDNLTSVAAGTCYGSKTFQNGKWHEATGTSVSYSLDANKCTEFGFMIDTSKATVGTQYRLRLVESDGEVLDSYLKYPTFTIVSETNNTKRYSKESILTALGSGSETCGSGIYNYNCTTVYPGSAPDFYGNTIAIGTDGLPVIAFADGTNLDLRVCKCGNSSCSSGNTCTTVESIGVGITPSIAIGTDGLPIIAHHKTGPDYDLRVCKCGNSSCSSGNTCTTVDSTNGVGLYTSIAIGTDGLPIIAHHDGTNYDLRVCKCGNSSCSSGNTCTTIDSTNNVGVVTSIAIGTDGLPIIAHRDITNYDLRVCKCGNSSCSSGNTCTTVDSSGNIGIAPSIAISTDGFPVIAHGDVTNGNLRFCKCGNSSCSSGNTCTVVDSTGVVYGFISLAIGVDGLPVASYNDTSKNLKVIKGIGLPKTAKAFFNNFVKTDRQIKFKSDTTNSQFLEHSSLMKDGLMYWFDKKGYDNVSGHDGNRDQVTSSANESPVYEFIDKHSSSSNNIYVQWTGRSNVAASSKNIKLEIYNWNTNSWETVIIESSCAANTDCSISGSKTSSLSYYYFPRYTYDSTKAEKDTTSEYYTYWRVYQETAAGSQTLQTDDWTISSVPVITVSGNAYNDETSTALTECDGSTGMISLRIGETTYGPVSCADLDGAFTFRGVVSGAAETSMILWIDGQTPKASTVNLYSGSGNVSSLKVRKDRLMIMSDSGNVTNANLGIWDNANDTDVIYDVDSSNNLTLEDGYKLIVNSGDTYAPGAQVITSPSASQASTDGDILIQSTATMNMETYSLSCGGDFTNLGTLTLSSGQTTTFTATSTGHTIAHGTATFQNVIFNGTGGGWQFNSSATISNDLTITAGTLSGTQNITINGGDVTGNGTINLTGGTFTLDGTGNFGGNTNWTFYNLTFGDGSGATTTTKTGTSSITVTNVLTISASQTLNAGDDTWILSGSGTPFVVVNPGLFIASSSTFKYTATFATNITGEVYNNLELSPSGVGSPTFSPDYTTNTMGYLTVGNGTNEVTVNFSGYTLNVEDNFTISANATFIAPANDNSFTVGGSWLNSGTFNHSNSTVIFNATTTGKMITSGGSAFYNLTFDGVGGGWTFAAGNHDVDYNFTITNGTVTASSGILYIGRNFTNSGTFNHGSGTVTLDTTNTATISGSTTFYNLTSSTASKSIVFTAGTTQTIATGGSLTLNGGACDTMINLSSSSSPTQWNINVQSGVTVTINYIDVSDSNATGTAITANNSYETNNNNTNWTVNAGECAVGITISGSSNLSGGTVVVAINSSLQSGKTGTISGGSWSIASVSVNSEDIVTVWVDGAADADESTGVAKYDGSGDITGMVLNQHVLSVGSVDDQSLTVTNLGQYDHNNDEDIMHSANSSVLDVDAGGNYMDEKIDILSGDTLTIGGGETLITHDLAINGSLTSGGAATFNISGSWDNNSDFNSSSETINFTSTTSETIDSSGATDADVYKVVLNGSGGQWTLNSALTINDDLITTAGTLAGTNNLNVSGGDINGTNGSINLTGGTVTLSGTGNLGPTGSGTYTFNNLTLSGTTTSAGNFTASSVLTISGGYSLDASDDTIILTGSGTPFVVTGTFTPSSSTVKYTATSATNITATTYNNLELSPSAAGSPTFTLASGTINTNGYLTIGDGTNPVTVSANTNDPTLNIDGNITISANAAFTASQTGTFSAGGSWSNSGTFTHSNGTVTFDATTTGKTITDGGDPFYNIVFNGTGGEWLYQDGASTAPNQTTVQAGTPTFLNTKKGTVSVTGGQLNSDWYVGIHLVDATNTDTNIDTDQDSDIEISENSGTPQSSVWKYNSGWGSPATSQTTGTDTTGINPQPTTNGAIRIREYSMTNSSTCPGAGCTLYKYNMRVNWQSSYGQYDYYDGYGENYLTSCWAGSSTSCNDDSSDDDAIGENWYRATPSFINGIKPYDGLDEPPDQYGTWYAGMIVGLDVTISDYTIEFGQIEPGADPTNQTNNITVETGAADGYIVYTFSTQEMTFGSNTITDWTGTNSSPTSWSSGEGFGYSTDDYTLTGGTADRFSGPKYAGFTHAGPGYPVADRTGPTLTAQGQNTITYRLGTSATTAAGPYSTTVIFNVVPQY